LPPAPGRPRHGGRAASLCSNGFAATIAVLLAVDAYVQLHDAGLYDTVTTSTLSQGTLFPAQAAAAVALALLIRPYGRSRCSSRRRPPDVLTPAEYNGPASRLMSRRRSE
jgi:hypothetical protein